MSSRKVKDSAAVDVRFINSPVTSRNVGDRSPQSGGHNDIRKKTKTAIGFGHWHDQ